MSQDANFVDENDVDEADEADEIDANTNEADEMDGDAEVADDIDAAEDNAEIERVEEGTTETISNVIFRILSSTVR